MSKHHDLSGSEAVTKLRYLVDTTPTCMFGSGLKDLPMHLCPMQVQDVDHQGTLWFFSGADSDHNRKLEMDPRAHLIFCNPGKIEYFTIFGETTIYKESPRIEELWNKMVEAWFPGGPHDPNLTLIAVRPLMTHYWDTENGKLATFAKILTAGLIGGDAEDVGVQGKLSI